MSILVNSPMHYYWSSVITHHRLTNEPNAIIVRTIPNHTRFHIRIGNWFGVWILFEFTISVVMGKIKPFLLATVKCYVIHTRRAVDYIIEPNEINCGEEVF